MIRKRIVFFGSVQGVGFRWRARHAAGLYGCTGFCRNEFDGSVVMEIQGTEEQIDNVVLAVDRGTYVDIQRMDVRTIPVEPGERDFITE
ncbi:MAG: acylphosphatase [Clostridia bacterium]|nr:acylphosphatase [Clostridia bacterium]